MIQSVISSGTCDYLGFRFLSSNVPTIRQLRTWTNPRLRLLSLSLSLLVTPRSILKNSRTNWSINDESSSCSWIQKYALFDESKPYTRNLIHTDHKSYTLLMLCWNPNQESPIHDHPCDGCWMQCIKGKVQECRYDSSTLQCISDTTVNEGNLAYITDSMGYHKVGNPSLTTPAITIHLYSPPFQRCTIWCSKQNSAATTATTSATTSITASRDNNGGATTATTTTTTKNNTCSLALEPRPSYAHHYSEYGHVV